MSDASEQPVAVPPGETPADFDPPEEDIKSVLNKANIPLLEDEEVLWMDHPHWLGYVGDIVGMVFALVFGVVAQGILISMGVVGMLTPVWMLGVLLAMGLGVRVYLRRAFEYYVITTYSVYTVRTFPSKTKDSCEIADIENMPTHASPVERYFGVGSIEFQSANDEDVVFKHVRDYEDRELMVRRQRRLLEQKG